MVLYILLFKLPLPRGLTRQELFPRGLDEFQPKGRLVQKLEPE